MIRLKDLLKEAPLDTHQTIGDFSKGSSFTNKQDRALVTNPVSVQKVKDFFKNTNVTFDFYFVNTKEARNFMELGKVDEDFIYTKLKISPEQLKNGKINKDNVTVFFTNNKGEERVPLTAWVIAHRMGHVMRRESSWENTLEPWLEERLQKILSLYGVSKPGYEMKYVEDMRTYRTALRYLCETIGTFKSARDKNLRAEFEFNYELFAQYISSGKIKLNPLPDVLLIRKINFGKKITRKLDDRQYADSIIEDMYWNYPSYAENVLSSSRGKIFVM